MRQNDYTFRFDLDEDGVRKMQEKGWYLISVSFNPVLGSEKYHFVKMCEKSFTIIK